MSIANDQQLAALTDKMNALENESRRILRALYWATKVRLILLCGLLLFILTTAFLFYQLYVDVRDNRLVRVQQIIAEQPERFSEPLTRQVIQLAEDEWPTVAEAFRQQAEQDSGILMAAIEAERTALIASLQKDMERKMTSSFATMVSEQEEVLIKEFPVLQDPDKMETVRNNMEKVYQQFGQRYYVEHLREELEDMAAKLDEFPPSESKMANISIAEQIALELFELIRMTLVYADNYVFPEDVAAETGPIGTVSSPESAAETGEASDKATEPEIRAKAADPVTGGSGDGDGDGSEQGPTVD